ncbi:lipid II:glycine glycyltransferase FemX [Nocardioides bizhenqiangii]|uniref:Peptidoglycan bridge formation glycyltransferase FemA/FemB family protein n=1 Tax=Nocardioides bizhenqiangii TaxID=3095076 RepID=A0ABZ0ZQT6_9ACTN|nr:peptidoglycan bridge formation glycyltransferase FemA/FemB family protein [Nocardioides sp. HM61]WQQ26607.1 peptidoglycan bridge formation glycyltransferase FemA/FemB family protein [Nocardioides sp. HM61]
MPSLRVVSADEHRDYLATLPTASFLQTPGWAKVKPEWRSEHLAWVDDDGRTVGAALVLYRQLPRLNRFLAYLPEGPVIDWSSDRLGDWLDPLVRHLKGEGAFAVRIGPPVVTRRWTAAQIKGGIADADVRRLGQIPPLERSAAGARVVSQLHELGWRHQAAEGGFAAGQPQFVYQIPLVQADRTPHTEESLLKGMNQQWRRNIKKADKEGVEVSVGTGADLKAFHDLYVHTAERDHFTPRPLRYFEVMYDALNEEGATEPVSEMKLWLARHHGDLVAATLSVRVGTHAWYSYGASSTEKRDVRGSNAVQWAMIRDALAAGATVYDLRGITDTLDADDSHVGLIQFKVGTGGEAVEYAGEWDLPINRVLYKAFQIYLARR